MNRRPLSAVRAVAVISVTVLLVVGMPPLIDLVAPPPTVAPPSPATPSARSPTGLPASEPSDGHTSSVDQPVRESDLPELARPVAFERGADVSLGRVVIPAIGVDAPFAEGVHDAVLTEGPGHWPGTPLPTQPGNAVLSGHRTTFTAPFGDLDLLAAGDEVRTSVGPHPSTTYRVTGVEVVAEAEYVDRVLRAPADPSSSVLTLFACHPKGQRTHRIVVTAQA